MVNRTAEFRVANYGNENNILTCFENGKVSSTHKWRYVSIIENGDRVIFILAKADIRTVKVLNGGLGWAVEDYLKSKGYI